MRSRHPCFHVNPLISPRLGDIVERGLSKKPNERYQSAREMADELKALDLNVSTRETMQRRRTTAEPSTLVTGEKLFRPRGFGCARGTVDYRFRSNGILRIRLMVFS